ncbi:MAG: DUF4258 domain-containing protein [Nanoarchaeota archaeon]
MRLILTRHAQEQMDARGIDKEQIKTAIARGSKTPQTDGLVARYTYIRIAYKVTGDEYIIKTVMID